MAHVMVGPDDVLDGRKEHGGEVQVQDIDDVGIDFKGCIGILYAVGD